MLLQPKFIVISIIYLLDQQFNPMLKTMFGSSLPPPIYVICVCLRVVVSDTCCAVFLFCFSSPYILYDASFSGLSIFDSIFCNVSLGVCFTFLYPRSSGGGILFYLCPSVLPSVPRYLSSHFSQQLLMAEIWCLVTSLIKVCLLSWLLFTLNIYAGLS